MVHLRAALACFVALLALPGAARAQAPAHPLALDEAIRYALGHSPALRASRGDERVADGEVELARALQLPQAGVSAELNRATGNVVPGSLFPVPGLPAVAGPPMVPPHFDSGAWGSALGVWGDWTITDLARRMRLVDAALARSRGAHDTTDARRLDVAYQAADAFLAVVTAREAGRSLGANLARAEALLTSVQALAAQQLRPGGDVARAQAEVALARTLIAQAAQTEAVEHARLAEVLGLAGQSVDVAPSVLDAVLAPARDARDALGTHPLRLRAEAAIDAAERRRQAVELEYLPRFDLVAALWLRGSGYYTALTNAGAAQGLLPDTPNWAVGVVASWPVLELFATRARARVAAAEVALERARRDEVVQALAGQLAAARATLDGAAGVAAQTQPALAAAQIAATQTVARYNAGLATLLDVTDAQRVLAQAELEDTRARAGVWRARLLFARSTGDLAPFLERPRAADGR